MNASKMIARMTTTTQKNNTMIPGIAYPATVLALATAASYPPPRDLFSTMTQNIADLGEEHGHSYYASEETWRASLPVPRP
jgi:hypothetical protein